MATPWLVHREAVRGTPADMEGDHAFDTLAEEGMSSATIPPTFAETAGEKALSNEVGQTKNRQRRRTSIRERRTTTQYHEKADQWSNKPPSGIRTAHEIIRHLHQAGTTAR